MCGCFESIRRRLDYFHTTLYPAEVIVFPKPRSKDNHIMKKTEGSGPDLTEFTLLTWIAPLATGHTEFRCFFSVATTKHYNHVLFLLQSEDKITGSIADTALGSDASK